MNLDNAITAHAEWKMKLRGAIDRCESVDADSIAADNCCELGRWLHGDGRRACGASPVFKDVVAKHAVFHRAAGRVAREINARNYDVARKLLDAGAEYASASADVGAAIIGLRRELAKAA
ncbi:CZB domain-containing protein [Phenylobacterium sp.]|uniref:CZB domain-containing protein n=1 Tax=Phenylobacterium sp. TaxID=1871053 RepID=UPI003D2707E9